LLPLADRILGCRAAEPIRIDADLLRATAAALSPHTLRALVSDLDAFDLWCRRQGVSALPANPARVAAYLQARAGEGAKPASLGRYKASLARVHRLLGLPDPTADEHVRMTLAGIRRALGTAQRQARPLRFKGAVKDPVRDAPRGLNLRALLAACPDDLPGLRDRALLSVAYDTGLRVSELVAIAVDDVIAAIDADARLLRIRRAKGDPEGQGATAYLSPRSVRALAAWTEAAGIGAGALFRRVGVRRFRAKAARPGRRIVTISSRERWDLSKLQPKAAKAARIEYDVGSAALHPGSVAPLVRRMIARAVEAGLLPGIEKADLPALLAGVSGHSTRVGLTQDLFAAGEDLAGIMDALRWKSPRMPLTYNRNLAAEAGAAGRLLARLK
jgi:integrase